CARVLDRGGRKELIIQRGKTQPTPSFIFPARGGERGGAQCFKQIRFGLEFRVLFRILKIVSDFDLRGSIPRSLTALSKLPIRSPSFPQALSGGSSGLTTGGFGTGPPIKAFAE